MSNKELTQVLWEGADILRAKMDANEYKNYLLPIVFFKYLSDKNLHTAFGLISLDDHPNLEEMQKAYEETYNKKELWQMVEKELLLENKYCLPPTLTYTYFLSEIKNNVFQREHLSAAFNNIEAYDKMFVGMFKDIDLYSNKLGDTEQKQNQTLSSLLSVLGEVDYMQYSGDALGDAYEYLIGQFASETGKKAGEFYTPKQVSEILTKIAIIGQEDKKGLTVYDSAMGSGSLLLDARKYSNHPELIRYYGQEIMTTTYNLAKMNMVLHGISPENYNLRNGDTLDADWPTSEENLFDTCLMNPPYSLNWSAAEGFKTDPRFCDFGGVLPPKSKADYAFLLHGLYHLKSTGTMAIVLPHGVLFRGSSEGTIRQTLCKKGNIYAVIGLPSNLFYNTSIPTCIIILKKERENLDRSILFIDASKDFVKEKKQNVLSEENINNIVDMFKNRKDVDKKAHLATFEELKANDFNLNIPRYVDNSEKEEDINIGQVTQKIAETNTEINKLQKDLYESLLDLGSSDESIQNELQVLADLLKGC